MQYDRTRRPLPTGPIHGGRTARNQRKTNQSTYRDSEAITHHPHAVTVLPASPKREDRGSPIIRPCQKAAHPNRASQPHTTAGPRMSLTITARMLASFNTDRLASRHCRDIPDTCVTYV